MDAINRMQRELRERETRLEMSRQQQLHKEKMAAVGSLASAIAHEINNPIMAIAGVAQAIAEPGPRDPDDSDDNDSRRAELILEHTRRIAQITRQISEFSLPQSAEPQLVDLNGLIRNTCNFIRFDKRFRRIDIKLDLDNQLPAIHAVADHMTQVVINLLVNAADALEAIIDRRPELRVATCRRGERVEIAVVDNGVGMDGETLRHACDEFFTTKARGKGSGLGLFLCKTLVEQDRGDLSIKSEPGIGTQVIISFPTDADDANNEE
jgi:signal transduction histidine kinase